MRRPPVVAAAALVLASLSASGLGAQDLKYNTTAKMELGGELGRIASMMPGMGDPKPTVTYMKGSFIRTDDDESSTIVDWSTGDVLQLDHAARTFTRFNFTEMAEAMAGAMAEGGAMDPGAAGEMDEPDQPEVKFDVKVSTDRTGERETINGYSAERVILTLEIIPKEIPEDMDEDEAPGTMAAVSELWLSTDFPEYQLMQDMQAEAAECFRGGVAPSMPSLQALDPRLSEAWSENLEAMKELEGTAIRTIVHFVVVPAGLELDRKKVLDEADKGLGSAVAGAAGQSARDAARSALGRLGRFGRGRNEEPEEEPAPAQSVLMRVTTEIGDIETADLAASLFEVPEGYVEKVMEMPGQR